VSNIDWYYHRKNCNSCSKSATFLTERRVKIETQVDARAVPVSEEDALKLLTESDELYVTRGTKVIHFDLKNEHPGNEAVLELLIGRSGKLRAPAIKAGRTLLVGFDGPTYEKLFS
jgi:arsenate reductase-like glutaredoxin family protein